MLLFVPLSVALAVSNADHAPTFDARTCADRLEQVFDELCRVRLAGRALPTRIVAWQLRRETRNFLKHLDTELEQRSLPPTAENFEMRWALKLLVNILTTQHRNAAAVMRLWLSGVRRMLHSGCPVGMGPVTPEFFELLRRYG